MSSMTLEHKNGSPTPVEPWLRLPAREFFSNINWDDQAPEVQELKLTVAQTGDQSLSLLLNVNQFFSSINWEGVVVTPAPASEPAPEPTNWLDNFTLDNFSDLF